MYKIIDRPEAPWPLFVAFPCGFFLSGDDIYLSYGKDDYEMWIAKIGKRELLDSLVPVSE